MLNLVRSLRDLGLQAEIHSTRGDSPVTDLQITEYPIDRYLGPFRASRALTKGVRASCGDGTVLHNHGLWLGPNLAARAMLAGKDARLVISPHGSLSPEALRISRWRKQAVWHLAQKQILQNAACIHVASERELGSVRAAGIMTPVAVIPWGVDIPDSIPARPRTEQRTLLFFGRLHPIKGIDLLLRAWCELQDGHPDWRLLIAGKGDPAYVDQLLGLARELDLHRVAFRTGVEEQAKIYGEADLFVLPSRSESFGLTVAEALAHGLPVVVSAETPWAEVDNRECGRCVPLDQLAGGLDQMMSADQMLLNEAGQRGREWMQAEYSWTTCAQKMLETYQWVRGDCPRPNWVDVA